MGIKDAVELYNTEITCFLDGDATCGRRLTFEEISNNQKHAIEELREKSKEELIDYILRKGECLIGSLN